jgi:5-methylcytosine-specific restriction endonuclease McrA
MIKKRPVTPSSKIRSALRRLWLYSPERRSALRRDRYTCQACGAKQSKAKGREVKVEVHHREGVTNWPHLIDTIRSGLLCAPEQLETLCAECHAKQEER